MHCRKPTVDLAHLGYNTQRCLSASFFDWSQYIWHTMFSQKIGSHFQCLRAWKTRILIEDFNYVLSWTRYKTFREMIYVHHQTAGHFVSIKTGEWKSLGYQAFWKWRLHTRCKEQCNMVFIQTIQVYQGRSLLDIFMVKVMFFLLK